jgi:hypothetical protein
MADIKGAAWKDAIGHFLCALFVFVCWQMIAKTKISVFPTFGVPAVAALFTYVRKRKDWFD